MKNIFVIFWGRFPGEKASSLFAAKTCESFADRGYDVTLLVPRRAGIDRSDPYAFFAVKRNFRTVYLPTIDLFPLPVPKRIAFYVSHVLFSLSTFFYLIFRSSARDVVYSNEHLPLVLASLFRRNTFYEVHDMPERKLAFYSILLRRVSGIVVTNVWKLENLIRQFQLPREKLLFERNAVEIGEFDIPLTKEDARRQLGLNPSAPLVLYTGHLFGWKGVDTLASAAARIGDRAEICFVGGTPEDIARFTETYGRVPNIRIMGHRNHAEIPVWQKAADVVVLPNTARETISKYSTSPMKLFEYMASRRPIVATDIPSVTEILDDSNAVIVPPDDPEAMADGIIRALSKPEQSVQRAERAFADVSTHTWGKRAGRILDFVSSRSGRDGGSLFGKYRTEILVFALAFGVRILLLAANVDAVDGELIPAIKGDDGYFELSRNLLEGHGLSWSSAPPYLPNPLRPPVYPFFLAASLYLSGSYLATILLQMAVGSLIPVLGIRIAKRLFASRGIARATGVILALEPYAALLSVIFYTETLFTFLFLLSLLAFIRYLETPTVRMLGLSAALLVVSVLVKPTVQFLPAVTVILILLRFGATKWKTVLTHSAVFLFIFFAGMAPWFARNERAFGVVGVSAQPAFNLYAYLIPTVRSLRNGTSFGFENEKLLAERGIDIDTITLANAGEYTAEALAILKGYPKELALSSVITVVTFFTHDDVLPVFVHAGVPVVSHASTSAFVLCTQSVAECARIVKGVVLDVTVFSFAARLAWAAITAFFFYGAFRRLRQKPRDLPILFLVLVVLYFAATTTVNGLGVHGRFRAPVNAILIMIALHGVVEWRRRRYDFLGKKRTA